MVLSDGLSVVIILSSFITALSFCLRWFSIFCCRTWFIMNLGICSQRRRIYYTYLKTSSIHKGYFSDFGSINFKRNLTVHKRFWYLISSRTMLAVPAAMEYSCCSVIFERNPLNMKMLGAMMTETLLRVILFSAWWAITRWKNSTSVCGNREYVLNHIPY